MVSDSLRGWYDDSSVVAIVLMVLVVAAILYGTLVLRELLAVVALVAPAIGLYLLWRLVRAVERVALAAEAVAAESDE